MIKGIIFDVNGTVTDILTDEGCNEIYRVMSNFLSYQGISFEPDELKKFYFDHNKRQRRHSPEEYPEFDVVKLFRDAIELRVSPSRTSDRKLKKKMLPEFLAQLFRASSLFRLQLYPQVREVLDALSVRYRLAALSDGQSIWAIPELNRVGLSDFFDPVIVSSDLGYRKPDVRIFETALLKMGLTPQEVIFVGNDMFRDVYGAHHLGIKTVFFKSNQGEQRYCGAEPDYIIYEFSQLPEAIRFLEERA